MLKDYSVFVLVFSSIFVSSTVYAADMFTEILDGFSEGATIIPSNSIDKPVVTSSNQPPQNEKYNQNSNHSSVLSAYQQKVSSEFKNKLKWMYDENMSYSQLAIDSPEKKFIDFTADKVASSIAQCNGRYFIQIIQGSSLVASTSKAGDIYEITDPSYSSSIRRNKTTKADELNGEEYSGIIWLKNSSSAYKGLSDNRWNNGKTFVREYSLGIVNGNFVDEQPFSEGHLDNLVHYEPLKCSDIEK